MTILGFFDRIGDVEGGIHILTNVGGQFLRIVSCKVSDE